MNITLSFIILEAGKSKIKGLRPVRAFLLCHNMVASSEGRTEEGKRVKEAEHNFLS
jgi:hypothetical protein